MSKDSLREEIKTRLLYALDNVDITAALNSMEHLFREKLDTYASQVADERLEKVARRIEEFKAK